MREYLINSYKKFTVLDNILILLWRRNIIEVNFIKIQQWNYILHDRKELKMKRWIALCLSALLLMGCSETNHAKNDQESKQNTALQTEPKNPMEESEYGFYFKEGEIFYVDLNKNESKQLTEDFADANME